MTVRTTKLPLGWWVHHRLGGWCPTRNVLNHTLSRCDRDTVVAEIVAAVREGSAGSWHGDYWADYIERVFGPAS